jgi:hypothetical protein
VRHAEKLAEICRESDGLLLATPFKLVDVKDTSSVDVATHWWEELTTAKAWSFQAWVALRADAVA